MEELHFATLGSGSKGNASLVRSGNTLLMVDCGFSIKESCRRLQGLGVEPEDITAMLVTHEHGDHSRGAARFARRFNIPVWCSRGTANCLHEEMLDLQMINLQHSFEIGSLSIRPVIVPHDAREPCQFVFSNGISSFGLLTDVGEITPHITDSYRHCQALMLEFNHDLDMLWNGTYSLPLKKRVSGRLGHLNNAQSAELLKILLSSGSLRFVLAAHLSESNNTPALVEEHLTALTDGMTCRYDIAMQGAVSNWYTV